MSNNNWLKYNGYSIEEEHKIFEFQLKDILSNTKWYLDNLEYLSEYKVSWNRYGKRRLKSKDL